MICTDDMKKLIIQTLCGWALASLSLPLAAQETKRDYGRLHGGIESNSAFYKQDPNAISQKSFGTNTYLTLQYEYKNWGAGLQYEIYEPPMRGFAPELKGNALTRYFVTYSSAKLNVTLGTFYEQFGSGLMFRSYEERALGVNTSLRGASVHYRPTDWLRIKALAGQPRRYLEYAPSWMYGADAELSLPKLWDRRASYDITLGGAWIHRTNTKDVPSSLDPSDLDLYTLRAGFNRGNFSLGVEYSAKGMSQAYSAHEGIFVTEAGDALLIHADYSKADLGVSVALRRVEHMNFMVDNLPKIVYVPMNYIPAMTKQHKYALPSLYPHVAQAGGEIGGQMDVFWSMHSDWMGRYPLKVSINTSLYRSLGENTERTMPFWGSHGEQLFNEYSVELEKRLSRAIKSTLGVYYQNTMFEGRQYKSFAQVADVLWRITPKLSWRTELQHMTTEMPEKGWLYGLVEVGLAPRWMFFASDMYSYGAESKDHFYSVGGSYVQNSMRLSLSYGRSRAGITCVGGICRYTPEYTGLLVSCSYVF